MKKKLLYFSVISLLSFPILTFGQVLNLGTLSNFAAYSGTGAVSNIGTSTLTGDIGSNEGAVSGFGLPTTAGKIYNVDATTAQAKIDLLRVYIHLSALAVTNTTHAAALGSGETITAGVYSIGGAGSLAGTVTLDGQGNTNAAFIIKFEGAFTAAANSKIILANGTRACNVYWIAEGAISIGASATAKGTLIAHPGAITVAAGSTLEGRMLTSEGAITFGPAQASIPAGPITIPISCDTTCNNNILGTVANFSLFTSVGAVANASTSGIIGDIGSNAGDISGFASSTVAGSFYKADAVTVQAKIDLQTAYVQLLAMPATNTTHTPAFGSGETLTAGVYHIAAAGSLAGTITLDAKGNPDAFFLFKFDGAFSTAAQSKVILVNGTRPCNVFWVAEGAVSMGTLSFMKGTLIAHNGANTMGANGNLEGRMFSTTGAIGFSTGVIYNNTFCFADPIAVIKAVNDSATINGNTGGATQAITNNDTLNGNLVTIGTATGDVTMTTGTLPTGITIGTTTGIVTVAPQTPAGTYPIAYTICEVTNPSNCSTTTTTITVIAPASAPTAITGTATICNGTSTTLTATGGTVSSTSSYQWGTGSTIGSNIITGQTDTSITVSPTFDTVYWVRRVDIATENITGGVTQTVSIISSIGGTLSANQYICSGSSALGIVLTGNVGDVVKWQKSNDATFAVTTDIAATSSTLLSSTIGLLYTTTYYRAIVANGTCSSAISGTTIIDIKPLLGSIIEVAGPTTVCGLNSATYSVAPVANATNYVWSFPSGMSVYTSAGKSVVVNIDALFREGVISVQATNGCQVSIVKTIAITKKPKLSTINGPIATCGITTGTYVANTLTGAIYNWTVPAYIIITSGQGTPTIKVSYNPNYVTGNIGVTATNSCGVSDVLEYRVNNIQMPTSINGLAQIGTAISGIYTTPAVSGMGYVWSVPTGVTITSGQKANSVSLSFAPTFTSGTISAAMISSCGTSTARTFDINRSQPIMAIYGPESLCGIAQITYDTIGKLVDYTTLYATYTVPPVSDVLQYVWTVPQGATIVSGQGTNNIVMGFDIAAFVNGNVKVTTMTQFGTGATKSLVLNRVGGKIAGITNVCSLTTATYSVPNTIGTNFTWIVPSWMSVVSGQGTNVITVSVGTSFTNDNVRLNFLSNCNTNESFILNVGCNKSTNIKDAQCGSTLVNLDSSIYPNPVPGAQAYKYQVTNGSNVRLYEPTSPLFNLTQLPGGATYKTVYSVQVAVKINGVWGGFGSPCTITTPLPVTKVKAAICGTTLATISTSVYADALIGVQGYRFEVTDPTNNVRTFEAVTNLFNLTQLTGLVAYNTIYSIRVAANANGVWGAYGAYCAVTTPGVTPTKLMDSQCGTTLAALNSSVYYGAVYGAQAYRFEVTKGTTVLTYDLTNTANLFNLTQLANGASYATTYSIRVASNINGIWTAYGTACNITTPSAITQVKALFCGTTLTTLSTSVYADALIGVQSYRFEVTNGTTVRTFDATSNLFNLTQLTNGAAYGTTYSIRVAVSVNGVWGAYGASCALTTPAKIVDKRITKIGIMPETVKDTQNATVEYTVKAYPNPFSNTFKLELSSASENTVEVTIYDMTGKMITSLRVEFANINTIELGEQYPAGAYNVIIRQGNDTKTIRMIKR